MPNIHRLKATFTSGELSPLLANRADFDRFANGCKVLKNAACLTQGPAKRRSGFEFIHDLTSTALGLDPENPEVRLIPFIFNELQAYALVFYYHTDGNARMVIGDQDGSLLTYLDPAPTECPEDQTPAATIDPAVDPGDIVFLDMPTGFDIEKFDWAQSADEMHIAQTAVQPFIITRWGHYCWTTELQYFTRSGGATGTAYPSDSGFPEQWPQPTDETADEVDWEYTDAELAKGWPEKVVFHQQRLVYAANVLNRQTVWMTKAGDFQSFSTLDETTFQLTDDSAVTFTLDSGTQNRIQWLQSSKALNVGTMGNEWTVVGNNRTALTPSNILAQRQTNNGSEPLKPLLIGLATLFVERHGRTTNEFVYDFNYDSYKNADVTILAPHLTEHYSIIDWTYQQTPDGILWCVREDGKVIALTYQRDHKVVGWHTHDTDGLIKAITSIPGETREDDVWIIVERTIDEATKLYLERLSDWFSGDESIDGQFLDSWIEYSGTATDTITGLEHLEAKEVHILADGSVHPPRTVVDGEIELDDEYSEVLVGLQYITEIRPYLMDLTGKTGSSVGRMQRIVNVDVNLYNSLGMYVGREDSEDGEYSEEIPFRVPGDMTGEPVPLFNGIKHLSFPEGFDRKAEYFIRQEQPLPLTVLGIIDSVEVFE